MTYNVDGVFPDSLVSTLEGGTNLLLSGPAMSGKRSLLLQLLARGVEDGDGSVLVTARDPAEDIISAYDETVGSEESYLRVIDCVTAQSGNPTDGERVTYISSPGDLTGMGIQFSEIARGAQSAGIDELRVGFDSLSPLLMYVDIERLFRFLHVFTSQIQSQGWLGVFSIDPESHDDQTINTLRQLFDGVVEVRLNDGDRELRIRGVTDSPTEWATLE